MWGVAYGIVFPNEGSDGESEAVDEPGYTHFL